MGKLLKSFAFLLAFATFTIVFLLFTFSKNVHSVLVLYIIAFSVFIYISGEIIRQLESLNKTVTEIKTFYYKSNSDGEE